LEDLGSNEVGDLFVGGCLIVGLTAKHEAAGGVIVKKDSM
jgi:hypothetical protein